MKFRTSFFAAIGILSFVASNSAQGKKAPIFTSVYTDLKTSCRSYSGSNGSDGYSICKGPSDYQLRIYYSAATTQINAERRGKYDNFPVMTAALDLKWERAKAEWRLANGKPFALIMRSPKYEAPAAGEYFGKVIGQELVVTGLLGFEKLKTSIDAKTTGANELAREAADSEYLAKK